MGNAGSAVFRNTLAQLTDKKQAAMAFLTERLNANKLGVKFDEKQLDTVIELAVRELKGGNTHD